MAHIPESEFSWRPDTYALIPFAGIAVVRDSDRAAFLEFCKRLNYEVMSVECSGGLRAFRMALDELIGYRREIGISLADQTSADALDDGWSLLPDESPTRLVLELINAHLPWNEDKQWTSGLLSIVSRQSRRHMVGGSLFFTALVIPEDSQMIGAAIDTLAIPGPLHRNQLEREPVTNDSPRLERPGR